MEIIMSIFPRGHSVVRALLLGCLVFLAAGPQVAHALVLDWDTVTWTAGSVNNSYDLNGDAVNDIAINITKQGNGPVFAIDPTSGVQTPAITQTLTGGLSPVQNSLMIAGNLHTNTDLTVQISFPSGTPGANNVSFSLFDIDVTTNSDIINSIYGVAVDGTHVAATITNVGPGVTLSGSGLAQTLTGNVVSSDNSANGNATISFGATVITDVFFTFGNTAGGPKYQDIAIDDITFTPVPEINPAVTAVGSCFLAFGLTIFARRRAKMRASSLRAAQL
jgi:hypothetical protein